MTRTIKEVEQEIWITQNHLDKLYEERRRAVAAGVPCKNCGGEGSVGREYNERSCGKCHGLGAVDR